MAAYLHIPFCFHKCHYCDFYSIVDSAERQAIFVDRLIGEMAAAGDLLPGPVHSIYTGGGTPTLLRSDLWRRLLPAIVGSLRPAPGAEFTVEANPETVTADLASILAEGGVNRVSIGAQSFDPRHLKTLERWHDPANVGRAVKHFRRAGMESINLDLIFAIPGQSLADWEADLDAALTLEPDHLSCYGLMYEPNTPLTQKLRRGRIARVDEEIEAAMYGLTVDRLASAGFEHYEISAWAKPGKRCRHNMIYWTNGDWWPLGPSAAGHVNGVRWRNVPRLGEYLASQALPPIVDVERLDEDGRVGEQLMLGLRLIEGIDRPALDDLLARGARGRQRAAVLRRAADEGLLAEDQRGTRFTRGGLLMADTVIADLL